MRLTNAQTEQLRELLMTRWDPIGIHTADVPPDERARYWDEYDNYLPVLAGRLARGDGADELTDYLAGVRTVDMELAPNPERDRAAALAMVDWHTRLTL